MIPRWLCAGLLASLIIVALLWSGSGSMVLAQDPPDTPDSPTSPIIPNSTEDIRIHQSEVNAYKAATTDCSTPSLECLVRNTTRFVAIEWVNEIMGKQLAYQDPATATTTPTTQYPANGGLVASTFGLISTMYSYPPATSGRYVAYVMDSAGFAPPAYAQGLGFASLDPVLTLWESMRNLSYFFFIGAFIIIGFLIMFRQKISGQTAVTAQQAIPSIIVSLVAVTFSYAISGLLIDVMYLAMYLILILFDGVDVAIGDTTTSNLISFNIFQLGGYLIKRVSFTNFGDNVDLVTSAISNMGVGQRVSGFLGFAGGLTMSIILAVAILIGMVKLFFELLKSYANVLMGVIFAPLYLMMGAFPGKNAFMPWFKNMVGNLAAFPTVLLFVALYSVFTSEMFAPTGEGAGFMPPYLLGGGQGDLAGFIVGLAIILALPEIVKEVKKKLGASEGGFGQMVAREAFQRGAIASVPTAAVLGSVGAGVGGGLTGFAKGWYQTRTPKGAPNLPTGLRLAAARRRAGNEFTHGLGSGVRLGKRIVTAIGGRAPAGLAGAALSGYERAANYVTPEERIKRIREGRTLADWQRRELDRDNYADEEALAKQLARQRSEAREKRLKNRLYQNTLINI